MVPSEAPRCDRGEAASPCGSPATFAYLWEWGEKGTCCAVHAQLLQQIAGQINRQVSIYPLQPAAAPALTRDERTQLWARNKVLEEELEEAKARGLELYRVNGQLVSQNNLATVREREALAQLKDAKSEVLSLRGRLEERDAEHAELVMELERLRTVESLVSGLTEPASKPNVVD
jgi:hypothetical protein